MCLRAILKIPEVLSLGKDSKTFFKQSKEKTTEMN
jgi:hypothetical protein